MVGFYYRYRLRCDALVSAVAAILCHIFIRSEFAIFDSAGSAQVKASVLNLFATSASLLGFVIAAGTFLIGHVKGDEFKVLRSSKSYAELPRLISSSIWRLLFLTVFSLLASVVREDVLRNIAPLLVFLACWSLMALSALTWVVTRILAIPVK